eukprot:CAMPEP_0172553630 /NCGR_PEP_ID=MMETSP1067-20121228/51314_1 /TAXON_ID=265564 ORGANISM="Thalassiosira punctigera, Strain Tpunct2005C2" /NCGR_SAMPLE_ID=MMETSP1067 /ASSEMBLY_ACC=CAM_ASM_000444 /LENGTH=696 /DNA_ID=CAMNT_0013341845 /DNA_START=214 /DNA_END=2304 /DNA_ORIENTATION=+
MAALCVNAIVVGARGGVGRFASAHQKMKTNRHFLARLRSTLSHPCTALSQNVHRGHIAKELAVNDAAFVTLSILEQRIRSSGNQQIRRRQQQSSRIVLRQQSSSAQAELSSETTHNDADIGEFFANPQTYPDFSSLGITSQSLLTRLSSPPLSLQHPSAVQAAVFDTISRGENDVIVGAETGSGKTLAYLLPLVEDVLKRKREWKAKMAEGGDDEGVVLDPGYDYARAIILVPNKELAHQAVRMAASICGGLDRCVIWGADALGMDYNHFSSKDVPEEDIVRLAILPGGLAAPKDFPPFRFSTSSSSSHKRQAPPDLVFATPANLGPMALSPKNIDLFADVSTLVVDEADMLLDGGYIRQLNNALMGFRRADRLLDKYESISFHHKREVDAEEESDCTGEKEEKKEQKKTQHVFVAATIPDYGLRSVDAYLNRKFPNATSITMKGMHNARHFGLNESQTVWNEIEDNKDRMQRLVDVLRLDRREVGVDGRGLKGEKVMVFLNTVKDTDGATNGLRRAGINAVPYHAKIPLEDRASNLEKFRRYRAPTGDKDSLNSDKDTIPVLVCTDVASRGLDIPGVTAIVQLQFALNVVSHLHRMGRCGRAGNRDGRGIVFYGKKNCELVEVVKEAEELQSRMTLSQDVEDELGDSELVNGEGSGEKQAGKVKKAFSRKRGFTKKRKKQRKRAMEAMEDTLEND